MIPCHPPTKKTSMPPPDEVIRLLPTHTDEGVIYFSPDKSLVHADQQMYCASDPPMKILSIPSPDEGIIDAAS